MSQSSAIAACCLILGTTLAGCAEHRAATFPSLAPRGVEKQGFAEPTIAPSAPVVADPALDARIAVLSDSIAEATRTFETTSAKASTRIGAAKDAAEGSEPWLDAQMALGDLDVIRAGAGETVTTLEEMAADRAVEGKPPYPSLDAAVTAARARIEAMSAGIAALQSGIAR